MSRRVCDRERDEGKMAKLKVRLAALTHGGMVNTEKSGTKEVGPNLISQIVIEIRVLCYYDRRG